jgi:hypothetical protein
MGDPHARAGLVQRLRDISGREAAAAEQGHNPETV